MELITGIDTIEYSGHSFSFGAATATHVSLSDSFIQTLGRWKFAAFLEYSHISPHAQCELGKDRCWCPHIIIIIRVW